MSSLTFFCLWIFALDSTYGAPSKVVLSLSNQSASSNKSYLQSPVFKLNNGIQVPIFIFPGNNFDPIRNLLKNDNVEEYPPDEVSPPIGRATIDSPQPQHQPYLPPYPFLSYLFPLEERFSTNEICEKHPTRLACMYKRNRGIPTDSSTNDLQQSRSKRS